MLRFHPRSNQVNRLINSNHLAVFTTIIYLIALLLVTRFINELSHVDQATKLVLKQYIHDFYHNDTGCISRALLFVLICR